MTRFPVLPKLRRVIFNDWKDELCIFSPSIFPSLESVLLHVSDPIQRFLPTSGFQPHDKVKNVALNLESSEENPVVRNLHLLMDYLKRQFPSVNRFHLYKMPQAIDTSTFLAIHDAFPELKDIGLDGFCDFASLCGIGIDVITNYWENGLSIATEDIPRKCSILSFSKLEVLVLTEEIVVTNDMIIYCFSKIPSLRCLSFHWNGDLSVNEVRDCLGHLQKIKIRAGAEFQNLKEVFLESMPNVVAVIRC
ncbi:unnamed protein product [Allacma fusca]|uniref:Uncharacterized protein n=1 Tax=Allacma fusca TaxID=39272 RepID=A0A8J2NQM9_9HEXA|nr:unnamed protein product [Allacma fusca]